MAAQSGATFILHQGDGGSPEVFTVTLGMFRTNSLVINGEAVDITDKDSSGWRTLLTGGGIKSMTVSGSGVFTDTAAEETVRSQMFAQTLNNYQVRSGSTEIFQGAFQITSYERSGDHNAEEQISITLESSGAITFTP